MHMLKTKSQRKRGSEIFKATRKLIIFSVYLTVFSTIGLVFRIKFPIEGGGALEAAPPGGWAPC